jgi:hypothetical protein
MLWKNTPRFLRKGIDCGGRYSGGITLKPGTVGELGDRSIPEIEKMIAKIAREVGGRVSGPVLTVVGECADIAYKRDVKRVPCPFAIVRNGEWTESWEFQEQRSMDQIGFVEKGSAGDAKRQRVYQWKRDFDALIESLPDDTLLTLVDCHH